MKRVLATLSLVLLLASLCPAVRMGQLQGKLIRASQTSDGTQIVYRLHILVGQRLYVVEQRPIFFLNVYMPHEFFINGPVLVRLDDRHLYLMRPSGREMKMTILMKRMIDDEQELAALNREADRPVPSDTVADMLNQAAEEQRSPVPGVPISIPRGIPHGN